MSPELVNTAALGAVQLQKMVALILDRYGVKEPQ